MLIPRKYISGSSTQVPVCDGNGNGVGGSTFTYDATDKVLNVGGTDANIVVDNPNKRIVLDANIPVIGNTNGLWFVYNTATSTYWQLSLDGLGALATGDTGSGSLPT